jgi:hypothetical protein
MRIKLTTAEKKKHLLPEVRDFEILAKVKELGKKDLNNEDKKLIKLIKSQLERDWRKYLIEKLNQLLKKYG